MGKKLKVAVIGLSMGKNHIRAVQEHPEAEILPINVNNHNTVREFAVFAEHILEDTRVQMDARQGAKTIAACMAIVESAGVGMPVVPDYVF